jgi:hypothetical protein
MFMFPLYFPENSVVVGFKRAPNTGKLRAALALGLNFLPSVARVNDCFQLDFAAVRAVKDVNDVGIIPTREVRVADAWWKIAIAHAVSFRRCDVSIILS